MERELAAQRERPPKLASSPGRGSARRSSPAHGGADGSGQPRSPALVLGRGVADARGKLRPGHRATDGSGRGGTSSEERAREEREKEGVGTNNK
jgi:hypothetical protein